MFVTRLLDMLIILLLVKQQETDSCYLGIWICTTYIDMHYALYTTLCFLETLDTFVCKYMFEYNL